MKDNNRRPVVLYIQLYRVHFGFWMGSFTPHKRTMKEKPNRQVDSSCQCRCQSQIARLERSSCPRSPFAYSALSKRLGTWPHLQSVRGCTGDWRLRSRLQLSAGRRIFRNTVLLNTFFFCICVYTAEGKGNMMHFAALWAKRQVNLAPTDTPFGPEAQHRR